MARLPADGVQILLLELQPEIVAASQTLAPARLRHAAATARDLSEAAGIPILASAVPLGADAPTLIDELAGLAVHVRSRVSPFDDPAIAAALGASGRKIVAIGGVSSEIAIVHAGLDALAAGYAVHILVDLCGGLDPRTEQAAFERLWRAGAVPSGLSTLATSLFADMGGDLGRQVMQTLDHYWHWGAHAAAANDLEQEMME